VSTGEVDFGRKVVSENHFDSAARTAGDVDRLGEALALVTSGHTSQWAQWTVDMTSGIQTSGDPTIARSNCSSVTQTQVGGRRIALTEPSVWDLGSLGIRSQPFAVTNLNS